MNTISEIQLSYNRQHFGKITRSTDSEEFLRKIWNAETLNIFEEFKVLFLNNSNDIIGYRTISSGGINSTIVDVRLIFSIALQSLSTGIIIAHNHPSGKIIPSSADILITEKIQNASKLLDIKLLDHIIMAEGNYYSFADDGRI